MSAGEDEGVERYWAEREERERQEELRARRREHLRHQLGVVMIWVSSVVFAFWIGYTQNRTVSGLRAEIWGFVVIALFVGGAMLRGINRHRRD